MLLPSQIIDINKSSQSLSYKSNSTSPSSNTSSTILSSSSPSIPNSPSCLVTTSTNTLATFNYNPNDYDDKLTKQQNENFVQSYYYNANSTKYCLQSTLRSNLFRFHPYQNKQQQQQQNSLDYENFNNNNNNLTNNDLNQQQSLIYGPTQLQQQNYLFDASNNEFYTNSNLYLQQYQNIQQTQPQQYYAFNENKILNHFKNYQDQQTTQQHQQQQQQQPSNLNTLFYIDYINNSNNNNENSNANYNENLINQLNAQQLNNSNLHIQNNNNQNSYDKVDVSSVENSAKRLCTEAASILKNQFTGSKTKSKSNNKQNNIENGNSNCNNDSGNNDNSNEIKIKQENIKKQTATIVNETLNNSSNNNISINNNGFGGPKKRVSANKKERRRTQSINNAFSDLRNRIPHVPVDTKLSKIKTLKLATKYIEYLMDVLEQNDPVLLSTGFKPDLGKLRKESRSKEIKLEVERKAKGRTGWPQDVWATELKNKNHSN